MIKIELDSREICAINAALELASITYAEYADLVKAPVIHRDLKARAVFAVQLRRKFDTSKA